MALRVLRYYNDEILRKKSKPVKAVNDHIRLLLDDMLDTMRAHNGIGLAAPQVGILRRVVLIDVEDQVLELINPEILEREGIQNRSEGCLSIPGKSGVVERPATVRIKALDRNGEEIFIEGSELLAVAICHEIDHLDGILFADKAIEITDNIEEEDEDEDEDAEDQEEAL